MTERARLLVAYLTVLAAVAFIVLCLWGVLP